MRFAVVAMLIVIFANGSALAFDVRPMPTGCEPTALASGDGQPTARAAVEWVDMIELNHCYDESGEHRFDQIICWEWSYDYRRYHVVAWWMPGGELTQQLDGDTARHASRVYRAPLRRETWTVGYDPEVENRKVFPCYLRRGW
jgi:hypothetical protein